jgi:hypothetical protein
MGNVAPSCILRRGKHVEREMAHEATANALKLLSPAHDADPLPTTPCSGQAPRAKRPARAKCHASPRLFTACVLRGMTSSGSTDALLNPLTWRGAVSWKMGMQEPRQKQSPTRDAKPSARLGWPCGVGVGWRYHIASLQLPNMLQLPYMRPWLSRNDDSQPVEEG